MAEGILGLGSSGSTGLSMELIEKLKSAERKAQVEPIETRITDWDTEVEQFSEIEAKINELLEASKKFDLFSTDANAFEQVYATTSGTAVSFDATDTSNLKPGTVSVTVSQLAQKDVYMSDIIADKSATMGAGTIDIEVGGETLSFNTSGKTYSALAAEMNTYSKLDVALEKVSDSEYRMIIKSAESGLDNALTVTQTGAVNLGLGDSYTSQANTFVGGDTVALGEEIAFTDGTNSFSYVSDGTKTYQEVIDDINLVTNMTASLVDGKISIATADGTTLEVTADTMFGLQNDSQTQTAQNLLANVDGIDYNLSTNKIIMQSGLTISALELGSASVGIQRDTAGIEAAFSELISTYNDMVDLVTDYTISADSKIEDKATIRSILGQLKDIIFGSTYGEGNDKSLFNYGVDLDKSGYLSLDSAKFNQAIAEDFTGLKSILVGAAEDKGIGTRLKEYIDELDSFGGLLTSYGDNMTTKRTALETEKEKAIEFLDNKYSQMAAQFAAYTGIISQFENAFSGLKMMIAQSTAGN
ncbi:MAG: flagellar filament capping protein FliD [Arcobacteraceae bacterium]|nr:flagellar filament capping protein FliD [Arcobacteraceae bacterium]